MIIGVDEVGRGCIAGDLLVCAFAVRSDAPEDLVGELRARAMDSKAFRSAGARELVAELAMAAGDFELCRMSPSQIDRLNIRGATMAAMAQAARNLAERLHGDVEIIFDGKDCPETGYQGSSLVKGDSLVMEISCASIIAKVTRDHEMVRAGSLYPGYGFEKHAGYGTQAHRDAIAAQGLCDIHRSWARKFLSSEQI